MSWMEMAKGGNVSDLIMQCVGFTELPKMRTVGRDMEACLAQGWVWMLCARNMHPDIEFSREHFQSADRLQHIALVFAMRGATPTADRQVLAASKADPSQLWKPVLSARRSGGRYFLAHLRLPHEHVASALVAESGSQMCFAEPIVLPHGLAGGALHLHFAIQDGVLLVAARGDGTPPGLIPMPEETFGKQPETPRADTAMDMKCVDPTIFMHYRGLPLSMNEAWQPATSGMLDFRRGRLVAAEALQRGVACMFCLRTGPPQEQATLARCLNLDKRS